MKKFATMAISIGLIGTMVAGGSLAYLTDRDSEANVFTVGDVRIDLTEEFKEPAKLIPGEKITKEATIKNIGNNNAYVWMTIAVPSALDVKDAAADNVIHWNVPGAFWEGYHTNPTYIQSAVDKGYLENATAVADDKTWNVDAEVGMTTATVDNVEYNVYTLLYNSTIAPGETTNIGLSEVYMDPHIDINTNGDWYHVNEGKADKLNWNTNTNGAPVIYVSAYGIQAEGVVDNDNDGRLVDDAYAMYQGQWDNPATPENEGVEWGPLTTPVASAEELIEVLANGGSIRLEGNITSPEEPIAIDEKTTAAIDLNTKTVEATTVNSGNLNISGGTIDIDAAGFDNHGTATVTNVTMNAGYTESDNTGGSYASRSFAGSETIYNDVNIKSAGGGISATDGAKVVYNSGKVDVDSTNTSGRYNFYVVGNGTEVTINGGEFSFSTAKNQKRAYIYAGADTTVYVNGGTFGPASTRSGYTAGILGTGTVIIKGGTFGFDPSAWVADGYEAVESSGVWTVSAK